MSCVSILAKLELRAREGRPRSEEEQARFIAAQDSVLATTRHSILSAIRWVSAPCGTVQLGYRQKGENSDSDAVSVSESELTSSRSPVAA
jgi:hypothetical protein